jgi:hypothetical protein
VGDSVSPFDEVIEPLLARFISCVERRHLVPDSSKAKPCKIFSDTGRVGVAFIEPAVTYKLTSKHALQGRWKFLDYVPRALRVQIAAKSLELG